MAGSVIVHAVQVRLLPVIGTLCLGLLLACPALAGPWTQAPGQGYAKIWLRWLPGLAYHAGPEAPDPGLHPIGLYQELGLGAWAELGVTDALTVTVQWEPARAFFLKDGGATRTRAHVAAGAPAVGGRLRLLQHRRFVASLEGSVRGPNGSGQIVQDVHATAGGHPRVGGLRITDRVWDLHLGAAVGLGLGRLYFAASGGVIARTGGYRALLVWSAELGRPLGRRARWTGRVRLAGQHPLANGTAPLHDSPSGIGNGTRHFGLTLELERSVGGDWAVGASVAASMGLAARQTHGPAVMVYVAGAFGARSRPPG